jgi:hypothetical protein
MPLDMRILSELLILFAGLSVRIRGVEPKTAAPPPDAADPAAGPGVAGGTAGSRF